MNEAKRPWGLRIADSLIIPDAENPIDDETKKRLFKRGLLQAGLAMLATPTGQGGAIQGISRGLLSGAQGVQDYAEQLRQRSLGLNDPSGLREFNALSKGLTPEDKLRAARIKLRLDGGASSAAIKYMEVEGRDGRKRIVALDPNDPNATQLVEGERVVREVEPPQLPTAPQLPQSPQLPKGGGGIVFPDDVQGAAMRTQQIMAKVRGEIAALVQQGMPVDVATNQVTQKYARGAQVPQSFPQRPVNQSNPSAFVSMSPSEKARAEAQAKAEIELQYAPQIERDKAEAKARVESQYAPQIAGATVVAQDSAKRSGEVKGKEETKRRDAQAILGYLDEAEKLLPKSTGSLGGAAVDKVLASSGYATEGSKATAQLNIIASELVRRVPRFEGPQSDADRLNYERAAGDLANPLTPVKVRLAALETMRRLQKKVLDKPNDKRQSLLDKY